MNDTAPPPSAEQALRAFVAVCDPACLVERDHPHAAFAAALQGALSTLSAPAAASDADSRVWLKDVALERAAPAAATAGDDEDAWIIVFEEAGIPDERFSGYGATNAAYLRFEQVQTGYNCHLFRRVASNVADLARLRASAAPSRAQAPVQITDAHIDAWLDGTVTGIRRTPAAREPMHREKARSDLEKAARILASSAQAGWANLGALLEAGGELENAAASLCCATPSVMGQRAERVETATRAWRAAIREAIKAAPGGAAAEQRRGRS